MIVALLIHCNFHQTIAELALAFKAFVQLLWLRVFLAQDVYKLVALLICYGLAVYLKHL